MPQSAAVTLFLQRVFDAMSNGSAYAALAVAISMVFRSIGLLKAEFFLYAVLLLAAAYLRSRSAQAVRVYDA